MSSNLAYGAYVFVWVGRAVGWGGAWAKVSCSVSSTGRYISDIMYCAIQGTFSNCAEGEVVIRVKACGIKLKERQERPRNLATKV